MSMLPPEALQHWREQFGKWLINLAPPDFPKIVCLCGSTRFINTFSKVEYQETLAGRIVLTIGCDSKSDDELFKGSEGEAIKERLDELHKRKIDLASEILVLNVGGYIGSSTRSEIQYAERQGKTIRYLEDSTK